MMYCERTCSRGERSVTTRTTRVPSGTECESDMNARKQRSALPMLDNGVFFSMLDNGSSLENLNMFLRLFPAVLAMCMRRGKTGIGAGASGARSPPVTNTNVTHHTQTRRWSIVAIQLCISCLACMHVVQYLTLLYHDRWQYCIVRRNFFEVRILGRSQPIFAGRCNSPPGVQLGFRCA